MWLSNPPRLPLEAVSPVPPAEDVWDVLERFGRDIVGSEKSVRQRLTLDAVHDSIHADAVYWYPGSSGEPLEVVGKLALPPGWCIGFAKKMLEQTPGVDGRLLRSALPPEPGGGPLQPHSAALVRVSSAHSSWIVAVNFDPGRRLTCADLRVMALIRRIFVNERRSSGLVGRMSDTVGWLVQCLTTSIDAHAPYAHGHSKRVARIAVEIGKRLRMSAPVLNDLYFAGLLHDLGLTGICQSLLQKPGKLTDEEYAQIKTHPIIGDNILSGIGQLGHLRPAVRHLHERFDGEGYPDRLHGENIPLMARILGVADAFDAMRSQRPYRPALPRAQVDTILAQGAGRQWDPCIVHQIMANPAHFHALWESAVRLPETQASEYVVAGWNADHTNTKALRGKTGLAGPGPAGNWEAAPA